MLAGLIALAVVEAVIIGRLWSGNVRAWERQQESYDGIGADCQILPSDQYKEERCL